MSTIVYTHVLADIFLIHKKPVRVRPLSLPNTKSASPVPCWTALTWRSRIEVPRVDYEKLSGDRLGESIAALAGSEEIQSAHLAEALQYRPKLMQGTM